ncbi:MAG: Rne/Rng family ribonuclease [Planctomycetes bacterium]|nr:Rne/Rng family ribonuclease [Planctomycetota bacterium]
MDKKSDSRTKSKSESVASEQDAKQHNATGVGEGPKKAGRPKKSEGQSSAKSDGPKKRGRPSIRSASEETGITKVPAKRPTRKAAAPKISGPARKSGAQQTKTQKESEKRVDTDTTNLREHQSTENGNGGEPNASDVAPWVRARENKVKAEEAKLKKPATGPAALENPSENVYEKAKDSFFEMKVSADDKPRTGPVPYWALPKNKRPAVVPDEDLPAKSIPARSAHRREEPVRPAQEERPAVQASSHASLQGRPPLDLRKNEVPEVHREVSRGEVEPSDESPKKRGRRIPVKMRGQLDTPNRSAQPQFRSDAHTRLEAPVAKIREEVPEAPESHTDEEGRGKRLHEGAPSGAPEGKERRGRERRSHDDDRSENDHRGGRRGRDRRDRGRTQREMVLLDAPKVDSSPNFPDHENVVKELTARRESIESEARERSEEIALFREIDSGAPSAGGDRRKPQALKPYQRRQIRFTNDVGAKRIMLINCAQEEESRVAILEAGTVQEYYVERQERTDNLHNIIKGRVVNVEAPIQAAFVDIGTGKNGFLHVSDLMPSYEECKDVMKVTTHNYEGNFRAERRIEKMLSKGDEVLVQITKDEIGKKGPTLSTYISLPGRYLVLMPGLSRKGVSKKIEDDKDRRHLKKILDNITPPGKMGFIVRTAGSERTEEEIRRDLDYLLKLWDAIMDRTGRGNSPSTVYRESDLVIRTIRDLFDSSIQDVIVDDAQVYDRVWEFLQRLAPEFVDKLALWSNDIPLFHAFRIEDQIDSFESRRIVLRSGASIVIDQTEALVAIDVNSGKYMADQDPENLAMNVNLEAIPEISRQIRIRDIGGLVLIDFIDMRDPRNKRTVESALKRELSNGRARFKMTRLSPFGIIEITRQRVREGVTKITHERCHACYGTGRVRSLDTDKLNLFRRMSAGLLRPEVSELIVYSPSRLFYYLVNEKRKELNQLEQQYDKKITLQLSRTESEDSTLKFVYKRGSRGKDTDYDREPAGSEGDESNAYEKSRSVDYYDDADGHSSRSPSYDDDDEGDDSVGGEGEESRARRGGNRGGRGGRGRRGGQRSQRGGRGGGGRPQ